MNFLEEYVHLEEKRKKEEEKQKQEQLLKEQQQNSNTQGLYVCLSLKRGEGGREEGVHRHKQRPKCMILSHLAVVA